MNRWGIPASIEAAVRNRDLACIYCGVVFTDAHSEKRFSVRRPTWEHIINDASITTLENIALCCNSCNASKGSKKLVDWLLTDYCKSNGISKDTVADVVRAHLEV